MYLSRIEIQGFKSFARRTVLDFNKEITAIVGPNGSGKSNISDAVRWVLGEQSMKTLRSKKSDDVIFAGSEQRSKLGMAEVSLVLDNMDHSLDIEFDEVIITRRIYRGGESEYLINNSKVRLVDIVMLLAKSHFGQKSYSIIGQGMIDSILRSGPEDRKMFFDEATGVRQYQIKREKTVSKLHASRENLEQIHVTLSELEPHLKMLTKQVQKLEEKEEVVKNLSDFQKQYYFRIWKDLLAQYDSAYELMTQRQAVVLDIRNQQEAFESELQEMSRATKRTEMYEQLQSQFQLLLIDRQRIAGRLANIQGKLETEYSRLGSSDLGWIERKVQDLKTEIRNKEIEKDDLFTRTEEKKSLLAAALQEKEKLQQRFDEVKDRMERIDASENGRLPSEELQKRLQDIADLQSRFMQRLDQVSSIEELVVLKDDATLVFQRIQNFYSLVSSDQQQEEESGRLRIELENIIAEREKASMYSGEARIGAEILQSKLADIQQNLFALQDELSRAESELKVSQITPDNANEVMSTLRSERETLQKDLDALDLRIDEKKKDIDTFNKEEEKKQERVFEIQGRLQAVVEHYNQAQQSLNDVKIELAKLEQRRDDLLKEIREELGLPETLTDFSLDEEVKTEGSIDELRENIHKYKKRLSQIGDIDEDVIREFHEVSERYKFLSDQVADLEASMTHMEAIIRELDVIIEKQFNSNFRKINEDFSRYFDMLFGGGKAKLLLVPLEEKKQKVNEEMSEAEATMAEMNEAEKEPEAVLVEQESKLSRLGIDIMATPPGKKIDNVNILSGGERTMTSIALICAIISNNPSPFVIMDEVDAALDEANSDRLAGIVNHLAEKTQFICITHNRAIMNGAARLYGVTMGDDGVSQILSLSLKEAEAISEGATA